MTEGAVDPMYRSTAGRAEALFVKAACAPGDDCQAGCTATSFLQVRMTGQTAVPNRDVHRPAGGASGEIPPGARALLPATASLLRLRAGRRGELASACHARGSMSHRRTA